MSERETALKRILSQLSFMVINAEDRRIVAAEIEALAALPPGDAPQTGADPVPVCQWREIVAEVERATKKFPTWPTDPLHALAVLGEEFGELTKAVVQQTYEPHKNAPGELRKEAIQTAAMALRFVLSLDAYQPAPSVQHEQALVPAEEEK